MICNSVTQWFGKDFTELDPLLQKLHREGGRLSGKVNVIFGKGVAGFMARRIAPTLGLPLVPGMVDFSVTISHDADRFYWDRIFSSRLKMNSVFVPNGHYPDGYWEEITGKLNLSLGVKVIDGAWYWEQRQIAFMGIRLPQILIPKSHAYKRIIHGKYHFYVGVSMPLLGKILSYEGELCAD